MLTQWCGKRWQSYICIVAQKRLGATIHMAPVTQQPLIRKPKSGVVGVGPTVVMQSNGRNNGWQIGDTIR